MQNSNYANNLAISQSAIKDFKFKAPKKWREVWLEKQIDLSKNEDTFVFGSLVDTLLFTPKLLNERYFITSSNSLPTGSVAKIVKSVYDEMQLTPDKYQNVITVKDSEDPEFPLGIVSELVANMTPLKDLITKACEEEQWNSHWKPETKVNKIIEKGSEYFLLLAESEGRKVISSEMNLEAIDAVNNLRTNKLTRKYFVNEGSYRNVFQLEFFCTHTTSDMYNIDLKGAMDILHIDDKLKTLRVVDFKTSHNAHNFLDSIKKYGYCDQLSFYNFLLQQLLQSEEFCKINGIDQSYKIMEPVNVVIDTEVKSPYIYEYNWNDIQIAMNGNSKYLFDLFQTQDHNAKVKKGWLEILNDIAWHINTNNWDYPREQYSNGKIKVNLLNS